MAMNLRQEYLWRAVRAAGFLRYVPFLRMLGLNGSIVRGEEKPSSDIDFLIVAKKDRLYTARFFATFLAELTGYRRKSNKVAGRICLNCYLPDNNLNIAPVNPKSERKVAKAYKYLIALVDDNDFESRFLKANKWFGEYQVSGGKYSSNLKKKLLYLLNGCINRKYFADRKIKPLRPKKWGERLLAGKFGNWVESKLMNYQVKRILSGKKEGDEIVCKKNEIRLHPLKIKN